MEEKEKIIEIEIERLRDFKEHPFQVKDDEEMRQLKNSISEYGVLNPLIVRPRPEGVYEIISGHRRKYASQKLGYTKLPVIIRVMTDEEAIIAMVDSNLQREKISHSEKAYAYMMKNEALKRKGGRKRSQSGYLLKGKKTVELISEASGDSPKQVQRYIKITELIPELMQQLDDGNIGFNPAVEIALVIPKRPCIPAMAIWRLISPGIGKVSLNHRSLKNIRIQLIRTWRKRLFPCMQRNDHE